MKRFALFCGPDYYPAGGWDDFRTTFDTKEEATAAGKATVVNSLGYRVGWYHVVDLESGMMVRVTP